MLAYVTDLANVRDAIPFPRTPRQRKVLRNTLPDALTMDVLPLIASNRWDGIDAIYDSARLTGRLRVG
jgi:hypothetical protein